MDVSFVIRQRLEEFGLGQRELAQAAQVTESYISQLLTRKKAPPAPSRTDIYDKMDRFLKLPTGELARLAVVQRKAGLKREYGEEATPLFGQVRQVILGKCDPERQADVRAIFDQQAFGELERLITQRLLEVLQGVAKEQLKNDYWLRMVADLGGRSFEEMRVILLEFLDTDVFHLTREQCIAFLDPMIESWDIDLATFALGIVLNRKVVADNVKRFEFVEREAEPSMRQEPGFDEFLRDASLSGTATVGEIDFLRQLRFTDSRPTSLFYYRTLQTLRDPLHFQAGHGS